MLFQFNPEEGHLFYYTDHLSSTRRLGTSSEKQDYYPYGEKIVTAGFDTDYQFSGKELDNNIGLYYFGARYYDPSIGRWYVPDPAGQFWSPYVYCADSPLMYVDPNGEMSWKGFLATAGIWTVGVTTYVMTGGQFGFVGYYDDEIHEWQLVGSAGPVPWEMGHDRGKKNMGGFHIYGQAPDWNINFWDWPGENPNNSLYDEEQIPEGEAYIDESSISYGPLYHYYDYDGVPITIEYSRYLDGNIHSRKDYLPDGSLFRTPSTWKQDQGIYWVNAEYWIYKAGNNLVPWYGDPVNYMSGGVSSAARSGFARNVAIGSKYFYYRHAYPINQNAGTIISKIGHYPPGIYPINRPMSNYLSIIEYMYKNFR